jgi:hypothetical protein
MLFAFSSRLSLLYPVIGGLASLLLDRLVSYIYAGRVLGPGALPVSAGPGVAVAGQVTAFLYLIHAGTGYFDRVYRGQPNHWGRYLREVPLMLGAGFALTALTRLAPLRAGEGLPGWGPATPNDLQNLGLCFLLLVYGVFTSFRIVRQWQQKQADLLRWQREVIQSQFEALKNQLNPHLLFNSLSVLTSLVYADPGAAEQFIDKLSKTYRYLLDHRDQARVPLESELGFLAHYGFLLEQRFGGKLRIEQRVALPARHRLIPPHSVMLLLEHILLTQKMSAAQPLVITLEAGPGPLVVSHADQPKPPGPDGSADRLQALRERYRVVNNEAGFAISRQDRVVRYTLPLFNPTHA